MTTLTAPAIRVRGITKAFKDLQVLRGVDFEVERGSIFALLGSNGAGKTTLVRILSTLLKADGGAATVQGFDVASAPNDVRDAISLTGQFAAVDEILTGRENLVLVAKLRHLKDPGSVADELLARFSLTDAGGVARHLLRRHAPPARHRDEPDRQPPVIFLDEPTTGLDPQARIEVWDTVKELANGGTTVLLTTQYLDEAEQLADRIAILHEARSSTARSPSSRLLPQRGRVRREAAHLEESSSPGRPSRATTNEGGSEMTSHVLSDTGAHRPLAQASCAAPTRSSPPR
jgi:ABC-2 type transport system ATP-binding protein